MRLVFYPAMNGLRVLAGLAAVLVGSGAGQARAGELQAVQYFYSASFADGSQSAINTVITPVIPAGKVLVIQSVSIYRYPANTNTLQTFVASTVGGRTGYTVLPDISGNTTNFYPGAAQSLTIYVPAAGHAYVNQYRTGSTSFPAETDYITVTGYLTAGTATSN